MLEWIANLQPKLLVTSASVSAAVSFFVTGLTKYYLDRRAHRSDLLFEFEQEQKRRLLALVGENKGLLVLKAQKLFNRLQNLSSNHKHGWLDKNGNYSSEDYYFSTTVERFLNFYETVGVIEDQAIYLDRSLAFERDVIFLSYVTLFSVVATEVELLGKEEEQKHWQQDHFYSDNLRKYAKIYGRQKTANLDGTNGSPVSNSTPLKPVLEFFDGLKPAEDRHRWDRMMCLKLLLVSFLHEFGSTSGDFDKPSASKEIESLADPSNLDRLLKLYTRFAIRETAGAKLLQ